MPVTSSQVLWAENIELDQTTGRPNRETIPYELRESGLQRHQGLPRPFMNQILYQQGEAILLVQEETATTTESLQNQVDELTALVESIVSKVTPKVGDTWITKSTETPRDRFGVGTWDLIEGKVLVGIDSTDTDFNAIGEEGGLKTHTHTLTANVTTGLGGAESLTIPRDGWGDDGSGEVYTSGRIITGKGITEQGDPDESITGAGNDQTVNTSDHTHTVDISETTDELSNVQPYHVVYIWERTA